MKFTSMFIATALALALSGLALVSYYAIAADTAPNEADAMALLKESKCMTCHSVDKKKDGPSYVSVAKKYKGNPEAVAKITTWVSKKHSVKIDGEEEEHGMVKTRDPARISNLVTWLLSR